MDDPTADPYDYSTERLLYAKAREVAELRELIAAVAGDLERLACSYPEHGERFLARAMRLRRRLWEAGLVTELRRESDASTGP